MQVVRSHIKLSTQGHTDIIDITDQVRKRVRESTVSNGTVTVFNPGSTASITTIEYEPGCIKDLEDALDRIAPVDIPYAHNQAWGDGNGYAHIRSALLKTSFTIPVADGAPVLGTWQQVIFVDFDNRPRNRQLVVHVMGE